MEEKNNSSAPSGASAALAAIQERMRLIYSLCCGTAPKQSVGELVAVTLTMPEWETLRAATQPAAAQPAQGVGLTEDVRKILQEFVDYHTEPAGMTPGVVRDGERFGAFLKDIEAREKDMVARARAILARQTAPTQPDALTPLDYRAQGREEALAIILAEDPENPFADHTNSVFGGEDYSTEWDEAALRELLHIGDRKHDAYDRAEAAYWDALGRSEEAQRMMRMVEAAPVFKPLHDYLAKQSDPEALDLMRRLQETTAPQQPAAERAAVPEGWTIKTYGEGWVFYERPDGASASLSPGWSKGSHSETLHMLMSALAAAPSPAQVAQEGDLTAVPCPACNGKREQFGGLACDECAGQGKVIVSHRDLAAAQQTSAQSEPCELCDGTKEFDGLDCPVCDGSAQVDAEGGA